MNIGLIDVDNWNKKAKFPNLALMKISAYHKQNGDHVEFVNPFIHYDKVYCSKVFDFSIDIDFNINAKEILYGGVGYGVENDTKLPKEVEHIYPDYDLYGTNKAYGFMSRGCPRNCSFCNVSQHQGNKAIKTANLSEFWNAQKEIVLLDPNITLCSSKYEIMQQLIDSKAWVDFSQGLDARSMTDKFISYLNKVKFKAIHMAWDNYEFKTYEALKRIRPLLQHNRRKLVVYVLVNYDTTFEQDLERIYKLKELQYWPYVMVYDKPNAPRRIKQLQRWINNRIIYETTPTFEDYIENKR